MTTEKIPSQDTPTPKIPSLPPDPDITQPVQLIAQPNATAAYIAGTFRMTVREVGSIGALVYLAKYAGLPVSLAAILIAAIVLPIELTRLLIKPAVARNTVTMASKTGALAITITALSALHQALTSAPIAAMVAIAVTGFTR